MVSPIHCHGSRSVVGALSQPRRWRPQLHPGNTTSSDIYRSHPSSPAGPPQSQGETSGPADPTPSLSLCHSGV